MKKRNYWGFRVNSKNATVAQFLREELRKGRLRQGWGYNEEQNLRLNPVDPGARRNLGMYNKVKKGDYILIPHMPDWNSVTIAEAIDDWNKGYDFSIDKRFHDYGHIFPVSVIVDFSKSISLDSSIVSSLKNYGRFWNMNQCGENIDQLSKQDPKLLRNSANADVRFQHAAIDAFNETFSQDKFADSLYNKLSHSLNASEWEYALIEGLKALYPEPYFTVKREGGKAEKNHGCDISIQIPGIGGKYYLIAIQVKDYQGKISDYAEKQISKASYFEEKDSECILIDKIVIVTHSPKEIHSELLEAGEKNGVRYLFEEDTKELCSQLAFAYIALNPFKIQRD